MFAPAFHPAMKYVAASRRELAIRTFFNILGPLANPANADYQVIGVPDRKLGETLAGVLRHLNTKHTLVVHGASGMDEISISGESMVWEIKNKEILSPYRISPENFGMKIALTTEIQGGTPEENARILRSIFKGEKSPRRDIVVLNAAAGMFAAERVNTLQQGVVFAGEVINDGKALEKMEQLISFTQHMENVVR
jgi:anthranilate phosphoribosyltransferase